MKEANAAQAKLGEHGRTGNTEQGSFNPESWDT